MSRFVLHIRIWNVRALVTALILALPLLIAACSGGATPTNTASATNTPAGQSTSPTPTPTGTTASNASSVDIRVTDKPNPDVSAIVITASNFRVSQSSSASGPDDQSQWITVLPGQQTFDLLKVVGQEQSLGVGDLAPGTYNQIRMDVDQAVVTIGGQDVQATVPSSVLKIVRPFQVTEGQATILTFDFDASKSIVQTGAGVILKPTVKLLVRPGGEPFVPQPTDTPEPTVASTPAPTATPTPAPDQFVLDIVNPADTETITTSPTITIQGRTRVDAVVTVNDQFVTPDVNGNFSADVPLQEGPNDIEVVASIASGDELSKVLTVIYTPGG